MKCWVKACKYNDDDDECTKYADAETRAEDIMNGGGCALTWFLTGVCPEKVAEDER